MVTHERDILKKDVKRISLERDGAYKHLSLTTAVAAHAASHGPKPSSQQPVKTSSVAGSHCANHASPSMATSPMTLETSQSHDSTHGNHLHGHKGVHQLTAPSGPHHHHRTASDTGTAAPSPSSMASSAIGKTGNISYWYLLSIGGDSCNTSF